MKLPIIFLKLLNPILSSYSYTSVEHPLNPAAKGKYYSELKLLVVDFNENFFMLEQFNKHSSDDINLKTLGFIPCQHP